MLNGTHSQKVFLFLISLLFLLHAFHLRVMTDDAYISFRYARNLAEGQGLVWNPGEAPVEGYTNFLWVLVLAALLKLDVTLELASQMLGVFFALATITLVYRISNKALPVCLQWVAGDESLKGQPGQP